jgi:hypothetical protein
MAINTSNSNFVNINNLPQSQQAVDGDLLILQTENGTQVIDFQDFNVVKTDAAGNATVIGDLSGSEAFFTSMSASGDISSFNYYSNNIIGTFKQRDFYNRFTINGGLVTSADYVLGSPEYNNILRTVLPNLTAYQNTTYKRVVDEIQSVLVAAGNSTGSGQLPGFFSKYSDIPQSGTGSIQPYHFNTTVSQVISGMIWVNSITADTSNNLNFTVNLPHLRLGNTTVFCRLIYTY